MIASIKCGLCHYFDIPNIIIVITTRELFTFQYFKQRICHTNFMIDDYNVLYLKLIFCVVRFDGCYEGKPSTKKVYNKALEHGRKLK